MAPRLAPPRPQRVVVEESPRRQVDRHQRPVVGAQVQRDQHSVDTLPQPIPSPLTPGGIGIGSGIGMSSVSHRYLIGIGVSRNLGAQNLRLGFLCWDNL